MKIISYSDLHLEFGTEWLPSRDIDGDIMILAGDITTFGNYSSIDRLLNGWSKPVLYVAGNHEYYTQKPMDQENEDFKTWLAANHPNVTFLLDEDISINGVHFFGGTMWTDFMNENPLAMNAAQHQMNDFRLIRNSDNSPLRPIDTLKLHKNFVERLLNWFAKDIDGQRVVISHHAPVINPNTQFKGSPIMPAFNSLDMLKIIEEYQPALWVYGHTHECDDQVIGKTRIIANQLGYPRRPNGYECAEFDPAGLVIKLLSQTQTD
jgi:Icc-related predicted phosphoesterase